MTERDILLKKISSYQFMIDDLKLYLDTHPGDKHTLDKIESLKAELAPCREKFEQDFGPLRSSNIQQNKWLWINAPWPWESEDYD